MIERALDPDDRRRFNIGLTDNGRALVEQHTRNHLKTIDHCFSIRSYLKPYMFMLTVSIVLLFIQANLDLAF